MRRALALVVALLLSSPTPSLAGKEFVATEADFQCLRDWTQVGNVRVHHANRRKLKKAIRILEKDKPRRKFPVGTIIQLVPFEAMVKRGKKFNPDAGDWEFFALNVGPEGTEIRSRGADAVNFAGGGCVVCHKAAAEFDFVCRGDHGCVQLPLDIEVIRGLQESDPRCAD